jgi:processive 1,2-diacylglycerol beta-glucosyltransferase
MGQRILILSAAVGAGHLRAAQAVELTLRQLRPEATVRNVDVLDLTNAAFRGLYGKAYVDLVNKAPHVLGYFYDMMDKQRGPKSARDRLRLLVERINLQRFQDLVEDEPWDVIINTHFLPAEIIASLKRRNKLSVPQLTVTTDFETHRLWVNQPCEHYTTATDEGAATLRHWGIPGDAISVTGIPIHPVFAREADRAACLKAQNLTGDRPVLLQLAGGLGVGPIARIYQSLLALEVPVEVAVVAGKNAAVKEELEKIAVPARHRARIFGFTEQIDQLMAVADVVVSKPGGLTTSEVLARGAAMAVVNPIPGQESRNSDFLLENGAAIKINNLATLTHKLGLLLQDPGRLSELKANAKRLGRPQAAADICRLALRLAGVEGTARIA